MQKNRDPAILASKVTVIGKNRRYRRTLQFLLIMLIFVFHQRDVGCRLPAERTYSGEARDELGRTRRDRVNGALKVFAVRGAAKFKTGAHD